MLKKIKKPIFYSILFFVILSICLPIYFMIKVGLEPSHLRFQYPPNFLITQTSIEGYLKLIEKFDIFTWIKNSFYITISSVLLMIVIAVPAGYGLATYKFSLKKGILLSVLFTQMVPIPIMIVPLYVIMKNIRLTNSLLGLIILNGIFNLPFATWILVGFFSRIPKEILESGRIDGCSELEIFCKIAVPISRPILITISAITFFAVWNEFLFANTFISDAKHWVAPVGLAIFIGQFAIDYQSMMIAATIYLLPPLIVYFVLNRYIVQGIASGYSSK